MFDYTVFDIITSTTKPHPELHCDVEEGATYLVGKKDTPCKRGIRCAVNLSGAVYHHWCAQQELGNNYVCECDKCKPRYTFYFARDMDEDAENAVICPWCREHCNDG